MNFEKVLSFIASLLMAQACLAGEPGKLVFEKLLLEANAAPDQELVICDFPFTVTGEGAATIKQTSAPCSCLEAQISDDGRLTWQPGETGVVRGFFKIGTFKGTVDKEITLLMADGSQHTLIIRMTTPELVKIEPKTLKWNLNEKIESKSFEIQITGDDPIHIKEISGTNDEKFPHQLEVIEEGRKYRLTVAPPESAGIGFGMIRLLTDSKYQKHQSYQAFTVISE